VHLLRRTDDSVHRARLHAQRAPDTQVFVDDRKRPWPLHTVVRIESNDRPTEQARKPCHAFLAAWRALVVVRFPGRDGFGIGPACGVAAFRALRLGQQVFDLIREGFGGNCSHSHGLGHAVDVSRNSAAKRALKRDNTLQRCSMNVAGCMASRPDVQTCRTGNSLAASRLISGDDTSGEQAGGTSAVSQRSF
jgi:hypothetical protein